MGYCESRPEEALRDFNDRFAPLTCPCVCCDMLAMAPAAFAIGVGSDQQRPLAGVVPGGRASTFLLTCWPFPASTTWRNDAAGNRLLLAGFCRPPGTGRALCGAKAGRWPASARCAARMRLHCARSSSPNRAPPLVPQPERASLAADLSGNQQITARRGNPITGDGEGVALFDH